MKFARWRDADSFVAVAVVNARALAPRFDSRPGVWCHAVCAENYVLGIRLRSAESRGMLCRRLLPTAESGPVALLRDSIGEGVGGVLEHELM